MLDALLRRSNLAALLGRDRLEPGPIRLDRRRIYILPTRSGLVFALVLLAMLLGAMNYNNSLAYALTFLLAGVGLVAMVHTFRTLHGLQFRAGHARPVFAGEEAAFPLRVENDGGRPRLGVTLEAAGGPARTFDVAADGAHWIDLHVKTVRRGRLRLPRCTVSSRFPVGLFRAWSYLRLDMRCVVYPQPADRGALPDELLHGHGSRGDRGRGADDFAGLRGYVEGDSPKHVYWRGVARGQGMLTKRFGGDTADEVWLRWDAVPLREVEPRLRRLTRWVLEAEELGLAYGLEIPGARIAPARGDGHRRACLEALALYGVRDE